MSEYLYEIKRKGLIVQFRKASKDRYTITTMRGVYTEQAKASLDFYIYDDKYSDNRFDKIYDTFDKCRAFTTSNTNDFDKNFLINIIFQMHIKAKVGATLGKKSSVLKFTKLALINFKEELKAVEKKYEKEIKEYASLDKEIKQIENERAVLYKKKNSIEFDRKIDREFIF